MKLIINGTTFIYNPGFLFVTSEGVMTTYRSIDLIKGFQYKDFFIQKVPQKGLIKITHEKAYHLLEIPNYEENRNANPNK